MSGWSLEYSLDVDASQAVIYEKIHGIWKADTAQKYHEDFMEEVKPLISKPWAKLVNLTNWKTSYPEVIEKIGEHLEWCINNNMVLALQVLNNPSTYRQLMNMLKIGGVKDITHVFRNMNDAERFLKDNWLNK